jgi:iron complex outermembrane receptor protein
MKDSIDFSRLLRQSFAGFIAVLGIQASLVDPARADVSVDPVIVTATRIAQMIDILPVSADRIDRDQIERSGLGVNLSETLNSLPGVSAQNRQNYAQDLQISVRGFGARSSFGLRGVRLYADGIPGTMPDGQGQFFEP